MNLFIYKQINILIDLILNKARYRNQNFSNNYHDTNCYKAIIDGTLLMSTYLMSKLSYRVKSVRRPLKNNIVIATRNVCPKPFLPKSPHTEGGL